MGDIVCAVAEHRSHVYHRLLQVFFRALERR